MLNDLTIDAPVVAVSTKQADAARLGPGTASTQIKKQKSDGDIVGSCAPQSPSMTALVPMMGLVSVAFLVIGFALPVLPLHVHQDLGLSPFVVGLVTGSQFAASLISRVWSGRYADSRGAKRAVVVGLLAAVVGGLLYLVSLRFVGAPWRSATILLVGRALLGGAESLVITGAVSWGLGLAGPANTGRVIAWVGMAMFASLAFGGHNALRARWLHRRCRRDDVGSADRRASGRPVISGSGAAGNAGRRHESSLRGLVAGIWLGIEHYRVRRDDRL